MHNVTPLCANITDIFRPSLKSKIVFVYHPCRFLKLTFHGPSGLGLFRAMLLRVSVLIYLQSRYHTYVSVQKNLLHSQAATHHLRHYCTLLHMPCLQDAETILLFHTLSLFCLHLFSRVFKCMPFSIKLLCVHSCSGMNLNPNNMILCKFGF